MATKYRVRMSGLRWFVVTYDDNDNQCEETGPYESFKHAEEYAQSTGLRDWDRG